ncbi:MAG: diguanylate cyclase response regulator [Spirochaetae bacterium HGW-Spirochaetae-1]|jgi:two-component system cell cycle response regulator|nr:MAG: diguanylate cyclase response regulator [Spirochaetae bacterium HGW-Spirochaetae-1]
MKNVLHIDNSTVFITIFEKAFSEKGIFYTPVFTMAHAFKIFEEKEIDLIITSYELDDGNGFQFIDKLHDSKYAHIPVVMLSSNDSLEFRTEVYSHGISYFMPKGISYNQILNYIDKLKQDDGIKQKLMNMKIAVLDDSVVSLNYIERIFQDHGILTADYFTDPGEFLKVATAYSVYLIDIILPGISGDQIIFEVRKQNRNCVIIAISTIDNYRAISNILTAGADDFLMKPLDANMLMAKIMSHVRTFLLMSEIENKNKLLGEMAITDGLTGLYNHNYSYRRLEEEIHKRRRYKRRCSIAMMDVDWFKSVNDNFGHQTGDHVLKTIAAVMKGELRDVDILGRYGGEEFILIFPETGLDGAYIICERVRKRIEMLVFDTEDLKVTISGGVVENDEEDALQLVEKADRCLYQAKDQGRNIIVR